MPAQGLDRHPALPTSSAGPSSAPLDVIVVGAGQAGLAVSYRLAQHRMRFLLVDAAPEIGHTWRTRWDSLRLFTPAGRVRRPSGYGVPGRTRHLPDQGPGRGLPEHLRRPVRPPGHAQHPRRTEDTEMTATTTATADATQSAECVETSLSIGGMTCTLTAGWVS